MDSVCGVNTIGGGQAPRTAASAGYDSAGTCRSGRPAEPMRWGRAWYGSVTRVTRTRPTDHRRKPKRKHPKR
jgi:hypothetical protein